MKNTYGFRVGFANSIGCSGNHWKKKDKGNVVNRWLSKLMYAMIGICIDDSAEVCLADVDDVKRHVRASRRR